VKPNKPKTLAKKPDPLSEAILQLVEQMTISNRFLAEIVAHNADMIQAGAEGEETGDQALNTNIGRVIPRSHGP
jgi:hypothetical protein